MRIFSKLQVTTFAQSIGALVNRGGGANPPRLNSNKTTTTTKYDANLRNSLHRYGNFRNGDYHRSNSLFRRYRPSLPRIDGRYRVCDQDHKQGHLSLPPRKSAASLGLFLVASFLFLIPSVKAESFLFTVDTSGLTVLPGVTGPYIIEGVSIADGYVAMKKNNVGSAHAFYSKSNPFLADPPSVTHFSPIHVDNIEDWYFWHNGQFTATIVLTEVQTSGTLDVDLDDSATVEALELFMSQQTHNLQHIYLVIISVGVISFLFTWLLKVIP